MEPMRLVMSVTFEPVCRREASARARRGGNGIDLQLRAHLVQLDIFETVGNEHAGVLDQEVDVIGVRAAWRVATTSQGR